MSAPSTPAALPAAAVGRAAAIAVLRTEARLFLREPGALFWIVLFPSLLLTILGLVPAFRERDPALGGLRVVDLYVPVALLVAVITAALQVMPPLLTGYRERGILRRMSTTPVRPSALLAAQIALHGAAGLVSVVLALAVGRIAFGVALPAEPLAYALAMLLTLVSALALGCTICALSGTTKAAGVIGSAVYFPMLFAAGVWAPVPSMSQTWQRIVQLLPSGAGSQALSQAAAGSWPDWPLLVVPAVWALVLLRVARHKFRWE